MASKVNLLGPNIEIVLAPGIKQNLKMALVVPCLACTLVTAAMPCTPGLATAIWMMAPKGKGKAKAKAKAQGLTT